MRFWLTVLLRILSVGLVLEAGAAPVWSQEADTPLRDTIRVAGVMGNDVLIEWLNRSEKKQEFFVLNDTVHGYKITQISENSVVFIKGTDRVEMLISTPELADMGKQAATATPAVPADWRKVDWRSKSYDLAAFAYPMDRYTLAGKVVDQHGKGVANAIVSCDASGVLGEGGYACTPNRAELHRLILAEKDKLKDPGTLSAQCITDADGNFTLQSLFGESLMGDWVYTITAAPSDVSPRFDAAWIDVKIAARSRLDLLLLVHSPRPLERWNARLPGDRLVALAAAVDGASLGAGSTVCGVITDAARWTALAAQLSRLPAEAGIDWANECIVMVVEKNPEDRDLALQQVTAPADGMVTLEFAEPGMTVPPAIEEGDAPLAVLLHIVPRAGLKRLRFTRVGGADAGEIGELTLRD